MPKKLLNGSDVASFIKERQRTVVRGMDRPPRLLIVSTSPSEVTEVYLRMKRQYAEDIGAQVEIVTCKAKDAVEKITSANRDSNTDGIIVQLPLSDPKLTDTVLNVVSPDKDIDGLSATSNFDPATPVAILWLLSAYNVPIEKKRLLIVGQGRLVGAPLRRMLENSNITASIADDTTSDLRELTKDAEVIISAAGVPRLITSDMVPKDTIIVDAGTSMDNGAVVGDVADDVRNRDDITITPLRGGVGPLTIAALFENLLRAAKK